MKLAIAAFAAALLAASPLAAQDGTAAPDKGTSTTTHRDPAVKPGETSGGSGVAVQPPRIDPKLLIDVFKAVTRPRPRPAPPPAAPPTAAPLPIEPAAPVAAAPVPPPAVIPPAPRDLPAAAPAPAAPRDRPRPVAPPEPPPPVPVAATDVPAPPAVAAPIAPPPQPAAPVRAVSAAPAPSPVAAPPPAQRSSSLLWHSPWLLFALLAAAGAIAAAAAVSRARRIARTKAALSLAPRLDLAEGSASFGSLALAAPPMSIRARLDFGNA